MAEEQEQQPNADSVPPGSSESFNQFKDRILTAVNGIGANAQGNVAVVTHSKPLGVVAGAQHAGWPEDGSIHMPTYESVRKDEPGSHEEIQLPPDVEAAQAAAQGAGMLWNKYQTGMVQPLREQHQAESTLPGLADMFSPWLIPDNIKNAAVGMVQAANNHRLRMNEIMGTDTGLSSEEKQALFNPTSMALDYMALWGLAGAAGKVPPNAAGANAFRVKPSEGGARMNGFDIIDTDGKTVGRLPGYYDADNKNFNVGYLDVNLPTPDEFASGKAAELNRNAHALGPGATLAGLRALAIEFPDIETVSGNRISGYRNASNYDISGRGDKQTVPIPEYIKEEARDMMSKAKEDPMGAELKDIAQERLANRKDVIQELADRTNRLRINYGTTPSLPASIMAVRGTRSQRGSYRGDPPYSYPDSGGQVPYFPVESMLGDMNFRRADMERSMGLEPLTSEVFPHEVEIWRRDNPDMLVHDVDWWQRHALENGLINEWGALREVGETRSAAGESPAVLVGHSGHYMAYGQREGYTKVADRGSDGNLTKIGPIAYATGDEKIGAAVSIERIRELKDQGKSFAEIGNELGISRDAVAGKWFRSNSKPQSNVDKSKPVLSEWSTDDNGVLTRSLSNLSAGDEKVGAISSGGRRKSLIDASDLEDIKRMRSQGSTYQEIGEWLGYTRQRVHQVAKELGLTGKQPPEGLERSKSMGAKGPRKWTKEYGLPGSPEWLEAFGTPIKNQKLNTPSKDPLLDALQRTGK